MTYSERYSAYVSLIDTALDRCLSKTDAPTLLLDSMRYTLSSGGKRIRPVMCLAACEMVGGNAEDALYAACAVEMIHTYSLIHDDLPAMDNDAIRRGKASNHMVYGEGNAILAGDGLQSLAFTVLAQAENCGAVQAVARGAFDMVSGQSMDINDAGNDRETLLSIHNNKTGALMRAAILSGIASSKAPYADSFVPAMTEFANAFGLLFQLTDDILDDREKQLQTAEEKTAGGNHIEHSSFVDLYGMTDAIKEANAAASKALHILGSLPCHTDFFRELVNSTLVRTK